jgi:hypothetical protein
VSDFDIQADAALRGLIELLGREEVLEAVKDKLAAEGPAMTASAFSWRLVEAIREVVDERGETTQYVITKELVDKFLETESNVRTAFPEQQAHWNRLRTNVAGHSITSQFVEDVHTRSQDPYKALKDFSKEFKQNVSRRGFGSAIGSSGLNLDEASERTFSYYDNNARFQGNRLAESIDSDGRFSRQLKLTSDSYATPEGYMSRPTTQDYYNMFADKERSGLGFRGSIFQVQEAGFMTAITERTGRTELVTQRISSAQVLSAGYGTQEEGSDPMGIYGGNDVSIYAAQTLAERNNRQLELGGLQMPGGSVHAKLGYWYENKRVIDEEGKLVAKTEQIESFFISTQNLTNTLAKSNTVEDLVLINRPVDEDKLGSFNRVSSEIKAAADALIKVTRDQISNNTAITSLSDISASTSFFQRFRENIQSASAAGVNEKNRTIFANQEIKGQFSRMFKTAAEDSNKLVITAQYFEQALIGRGGKFEDTLFDGADIENLQKLASKGNLKIGVSGSSMGSNQGLFDLLDKFSKVNRSTLDEGQQKRYDLVESLLKPGARGESAFTLMPTQYMHSKSMAMFSAAGDLLEYTLGSANFSEKALKPRDRESTTDNIEVSAFFRGDSLGLLSAADQQRIKNNYFYGIGRFDEEKPDSGGVLGRYGQSLRHRYQGTQVQQKGKAEFVNSAIEMIERMGGKEATADDASAAPFRYKKEYILDTKSSTGYRLTGLKISIAQPNMGAKDYSIGLTIGSERKSVQSGPGGAMTVIESPMVYINKTQRFLTGAVFENATDSTFNFIRYNEIDRTVENAQLGPQGSYEANALDVLGGFLSTMRTSMNYETKVRGIAYTYEALGSDVMKKALEGTLADRVSSLYLYNKHGDSTPDSEIHKVLVAREQGLGSLLNLIQKEGNLEGVLTLLQRDLAGVSGQSDIIPRYSGPESDVMRQRGSEIGTLFNQIIPGSRQANAQDLASRLVHNFSMMMEKSVGLRPDDARDYTSGFTGRYNDIIMQAFGATPVGMQIYRDTVASGYSESYSRQVDAYSQPHTENYSHGQSLHSKPVVGLTPETMDLFRLVSPGIGIDPSLVDGRIGGLILNPYPLSHGEMLGSPDGGQYLRTVGKAVGRAQHQSFTEKIGGLTKIQGGAPVVYSMLGLANTMPTLQAIDRKGYKERSARLLKEMGVEGDAVDKVTKALEAQTFNPKYGSEVGTKEEEEAKEYDLLYYFPYAKTEQIMQRMKNLLSTRPMYDASREFIDYSYSLGLNGKYSDYDAGKGSGKKNFLDAPEDIIGGRLLDSMPAQQYHALIAMMEERFAREGDPRKGVDKKKIYDLERAMMLQIAKEIAIDDRAVGKGYMGSERPRLSILIAGATQLSDYGIQNTGYRRSEYEYGMKLLKPHPVQTNITLSGGMIGPAALQSSVQQYLQPGTVFIARDTTIQHTKVIADLNKQLNEKLQLTIKEVAVAKNLPAINFNVDTEGAVTRQGIRAGIIDAFKKIDQDIDAAQIDAIYKGAVAKVREENQGIRVITDHKTGQVGYVLNRGAYQGGRQVGEVSTVNTTGAKVGDLDPGDAAFKMWGFMSYDGGHAQPMQLRVPAITGDELNSISVLGEVTVTSMSGNTATIDTRFYNVEDFMSGMRAGSIIPKGPMKGGQLALFEAARGLMGQESINLLPSSVKSGNDSREVSAEDIYSMISPSQVKAFNFEIGLMMLSDRQESGIYKRLTDKTSGGMNVALALSMLFINADAKTIGGDNNLAMLYDRLSSTLNNGDGKQYAASLRAKKSLMGLETDVSKGFKTFSSAPGSASLAMFSALGGFGKWTSDSESVESALLHQVIVALGDAKDTEVQKARDNLTRAAKGLLDYTFSEKSRGGVIIEDFDTKPVGLLSFLTKASADIYRDLTPEQLRTTRALGEVILSGQSLFTSPLSLIRGDEGLAEVDKKYEAARDSVLTVLNNLFNLGADEDKKGRRQRQIEMKRREAYLIAGEIHKISGGDMESVNRILNQDLDIDGFLTRAGTAKSRFDLSPELNQQTNLEKRFATTALWSPMQTMYQSEQHKYIQDLDKSEYNPYLEAIKSITKGNMTHRSVIDDLIASTGEFASDAQKALRTKFDSTLRRIVIKRSDMGSQLLKLEDRLREIGITNFSSDSEFGKLLSSFQPGMLETINTADRAKSQPVGSSFSALIGFYSAVEAYGGLADRGGTVIQDAMRVQAQRMGYSLPSQELIKGILNKIKSSESDDALTDGEYRALKEVELVFEGITAAIQQARTITIPMETNFSKISTPAGSKDSTALEGHLSRSMTERQLKQYTYSPEEFADLTSVQNALMSLTKAYYGSIPNAKQRETLMAMDLMNINEWRWGDVEVDETNKLVKRKGKPKGQSAAAQSKQFIWDYLANYNSLYRNALPGEESEVGFSRVNIYDFVSDGVKDGKRDSDVVDMMQRINTIAYGPAGKNFDSPEAELEHRAKALATLTYDSLSAGITRQRTVARVTKELSAGLNDYLSYTMASGQTEEDAKRISAVLAAEKSAYKKQIDYFIAEVIKGDRNKDEILKDGIFNERVSDEDAALLRGASAVRYDASGKHAKTLLRIVSELKGISREVIGIKGADKTKVGEISKSLAFMESSLTNPTGNDVLSAEKLMTVIDAVLVGEDGLLNVLTDKYRAQNRSYEGRIPGRVKNTKKNRRSGAVPTTEARLDYREKTRSELEEVRKELIDLQPAREGGIIGYLDHMSAQQPTETDTWFSIAMRGGSEDANKFLKADEIARMAAPGGNIYQKIQHAQSQDRGAAYLEGMKSMYKTVLGLGAGNLNPRGNLTAQQERLLSLKRSLEKTQFISLSSYAVDSFEVGKIRLRHHTNVKGERFSDTGLILGLDVLEKMSLLFQNSSHDALEAQQNLVSKLSAAKGLIDKVEAGLISSYLGEKQNKTTSVTQEEWQQLLDLQEAMMMSKVTAISILQNENSIRQATGNRLNMMGTSFIAMNSFLVGATEVALGKRFDSASGVTTAGGYLRFMADVAPKNRDMEKYLLVDPDQRKFLIGHYKEKHNLEAQLAEAIETKGTDKIAYLQSELSSWNDMLGMSPEGQDRTLAENLESLQEKLKIQNDVANQFAITDEAKSRDALQAAQELQKQIAVITDTKKAVGKRIGSYVAPVTDVSISKSQASVIYEVKDYLTKLSSDASSSLFGTDRYNEATLDIDLLIKQIEASEGDTASVDLQLYKRVKSFLSSNVQQILSFTDNDYIGESWLDKARAKAQRASDIRKSNKGKKVVTRKTREGQVSFDSLVSGTYEVINRALGKKPRSTPVEAKVPLEEAKSYADVTAEQKAERKQEEFKVARKLMADDISGRFKELDKGVKQQTKTLRTQRVSQVDKVAQASQMGAMYDKLLSFSKTGKDIDRDTVHDILKVLKYSGDQITKGELTVTDDTKSTIISAFDSLSKGKTLDSHVIQLLELGTEEQTSMTLKEQRTSFNSFLTDLLSKAKSNALAADKAYEKLQKWHKLVSDYALAYAEGEGDSSKARTFTEVELLQAYESSGKSRTLVELQLITGQEVTKENRNEILAKVDAHFLRSDLIAGRQGSPYGSAAGPRGVASALSALQGVTMEEMRKRGQLVNSLFTPDESADNTLMMISAFGFQFMGLGDYDGDSYQAALSSITKAQSTIAQTNEQLKTIEDSTNRLKNALKELVARKELAQAKQPKDLNEIDAIDKKIRTVERELNIVNSRAKQAKELNQRATKDLRDINREARETQQVKGDKAYKGLRSYVSSYLALPTYLFGDNVTNAQGEDVYQYGLHDNELAGTVKQYRDTISGYSDRADDTTNSVGAFAWLKEVDNKVSIDDKGRLSFDVEGMKASRGGAGGGTTMTVNQMVAAAEQWNQALIKEEIHQRIKGGSTLDEAAVRQKVIEDMQKMSIDDYMKKVAEFQNQSEAIFMSITTSSKIFSNVAGSQISPADLGSIQSIMGTTGGGLLGKVYNTVVPSAVTQMTDSLMNRMMSNDSVRADFLNSIEKLQQTNANIPQVDLAKTISAIADSLGSMTDTSGVPWELSMDRKEAKASTAYRFMLTTQQYLRDAALKPKGKVGLVEMASKFRLSNSAVQQIKSLGIAGMEEQDWSNIEGYDKLLQMQPAAAEEDVSRQYLEIISQDFLGARAGELLNYSRDKAGTNNSVQLDGDMTAFGMLKLLTDYTGSRAMTAEEMLESGHYSDALKATRDDLSERLTTHDAQVKEYLASKSSGDTDRIDAAKQALRSAGIKPEMVDRVLRSEQDGSWYIDNDAFVQNTIADLIGKFQSQFLGGSSVADDFKSTDPMATERTLYTHGLEVQVNEQTDPTQDPTYKIVRTADSDAILRKNAAYQMQDKLDAYNRKFNLSGDDALTVNDIEAGDVDWQLEAAAAKIKAGTKEKALSDLNRKLGLERNPDLRLTDVDASTLLGSGPENIQAELRRRLTRMSGVSDKDLTITANENLATSYLDIIEKSKSGTEADTLSAINKGRNADESFGSIEEARTWSEGIMQNETKLRSDLALLNSNDPDSRLRDVNRGRSVAFETVEDAKSDHERQIREIESRRKKATEVNRRLAAADGAFSTWNTATHGADAEADAFTSTMTGELNDRYNELSSNRSAIEAEAAGQDLSVNEVAATTFRTLQEVTVRNQADDLMDVMMKTKQLNQAVQGVVTDGQSEEFGAVKDALIDAQKLASLTVFESMEAMGSETVAQAQGIDSAKLNQASLAQAMSTGLTNVLESVRTYASSLGDGQEFDTKLGGAVMSFLSMGGVLPDQIQDVIDQNIAGQVGTVEGYASALETEDGRQQLASKLARYGGDDVDLTTGEGRLSAANLLVDGETNTLQTGVLKALMQAGVIDAIASGSGFTGHVAQWNDMMQDAIELGSINPEDLSQSGRHALDAAANAALPAYEWATSNKEPRFVATQDMADDFNKGLSDKGMTQELTAEQLTTLVNKEGTTSVLQDMGVDSAGERKILGKQLEQFRTQEVGPAPTVVTTMPTPTTPTSGGTDNDFGQRRVNPETLSIPAQHQALKTAITHAGENRQNREIARQQNETEQALRRNYGFTEALSILAIPTLFAAMQGDIPITEQVGGLVQDVFSSAITSGTFEQSASSLMLMDGKSEEDRAARLAQVRRASDNLQMARMKDYFRYYDSPTEALARGVLNETIYQGMGRLAAGAGTAIDMARGHGLDRKGNPILGEELTVGDSGLGRMVTEIGAGLLGRVVGGVLSGRPVNHGFYSATEDDFANELVAAAASAASQVVNFIADVTDEMWEGDPGEIKLDDGNLISMVDTDTGASLTYEVARPDKLLVGTALDTDEYLQIVEGDQNAISTYDELSA